MTPDQNLPKPIKYQEWITPEGKVFNVPVFPKSVTKTKHYRTHLSLARLFIGGKITLTLQQAATCVRYGILVLAGEHYYETTDGEQTNKYVDREYHLTVDYEPL